MVLLPNHKTNSRVVEKKRESRTLRPRYTSLLFSTADRSSRTQLTIYWLFSCFGSGCLVLSKGRRCRGLCGVDHGHLRARRNTLLCTPENSATRFFRNDGFVVLTHMRRRLFTLITMGCVRRSGWPSVGRPLAIPVHMMSIRRLLGWLQTYMAS
jgi:hypothetical protein